jgi:UDP-glucuronate decarboxylase
MSVSPKKDDPLQRCPDINRAKELLHWTPRVGLVDGLKKTVEYFEECLQQEIQT